MRANVLGAGQGQMRGKHGCIKRKCRGNVTRGNALVEAEAVGSRVGGRVSSRQPAGIRRQAPCRNIHNEEGALVPLILPLYILPKRYGYFSNFWGLFWSFHHAPGFRRDCRMVRAGFSLVGWMVWVALGTGGRLRYLLTMLGGEHAWQDLQKL